MLVSGLGRVSGGHPQNNKDGSLIYYETDKGFGVHIDADTGEVISVKHRESGAVVQVDGVAEYDVAEPKELTMKEAFKYGKDVEITDHYGDKFIGTVVSYSKDHVNGCGSIEVYLSSDYYEKYSDFDDTEIASIRKA